MPRPSSRNPVVPVVVPQVHEAGLGLGVGVLRILIGIIDACMGSIFDILKNRPPYPAQGGVGFDDS